MWYICRISESAFERGRESVRVPEKERERLGLFCRVLLQKRPILLRNLLIVATSYRPDGDRERKSGRGGGGGGRGRESVCQKKSERE